MINEKDLGIYVNSNKTFYVLGAGGIPHRLHATTRGDDKQLEEQHNLLEFHEFALCVGDKEELLAFLVASQLLMQ